MMQLIILIKSVIKIIPVIKHCPATSQFEMKFTLRLISNYSWVDNEFCNLRRAQVLCGLEPLSACVPSLNVTSKIK